MYRKVLLWLHRKISMRVATEFSDIPSVWFTVIGDVAYVTLDEYGILAIRYNELLAKYNKLNASHVR